MKIKLYLDIFPGCENQSFYATSMPSAKVPSCKRYEIEAEIPDHAFTGDIDGKANKVKVTEKDKDAD